MKAVVVKKPAKPLPPWLAKAKAEGAAEAKSGKKESAAHEKGESKRFEAAEDKGMKGKPFVNGGNVKVKSNAINQKGTARSDPKMAANKNSNARHMANGGKVK
jgi:hypothetical protein